MVNGDHKGIPNRMFFGQRPEVLKLMIEDEACDPKKVKVIIWLKRVEGC